MDPAAHPGPQTQAPAPEGLARELTGDLPCAWCKYNLRGLSVRSVCPECGAAVRATILARVDPYADVLRPISLPRATAAGMLLWSFASLAAALLVWGMRIADAIIIIWAFNPGLHWMPRLGAFCAFAAAVGALALIRPHAGIASRHIASAMLGVVAMFATAYMYHRIHVQFDPGRVKPYFSGDGMLTDRIWMRLIMGALLVASLFLLRPNARLLAGRSLLLRMGRVDRQTMRAMALSVAVGMLGDVLHLLGPRLPGSVARFSESLADFLIAVGAMLFTVGLFGVVIDTLRIAPELLRPALSIERIFGDQQNAGTESES